jgi:Glycosyl transferase family 2
MPSGPDIKASVVVIGYAPADLLARCLSALRAQQAGHTDTEILVVAHPTHQGTALAPLRAQFPEFEWLDASPQHNVARMRGLGIARSKGPVVALLEGDCMPASDWLTRLTQLTPSAAVGGAVEPGAFRRAVDWAAYFCEFARYMLPLPLAPTHLPGANVAYRRAVLPDAARLESEGLYETFVNADIGTHAALTTDPALIVRHERTWRAQVALATRFHHGRGFAALRVRGSPARRRLPYLALAVALPPILVVRVFGETVRRRRLVGRAVWAIPWIVALSVSWSLGEFAGYVAGAGTSLDRWR